MNSQAQTALEGFTRREFFGILGAGAAAASGAALPLHAFAGKQSADAAAPRVWIDPRIYALPKRPWRKIHQDFHNSVHVPKIGAAFSADEWGDRLVAGDVSVRLNLPLKVKAARAVCAGEKLRARSVAGGVAVVVPRVPIHEVVALEVR